MVAVGAPCWAAVVGALHDLRTVLWSISRVSTGRDSWGEMRVEREETETRFVVVREYRQYCSLMEDDG
ncbi:hypothetical protein NDU88_003257 [Pleurodeles waltl]|uniref:Secreted protein n=1 Tax=Pleurodeles waltl TaxID=8319 RepID=A0AAV7RDD2_PLEWA|nr:hypothetical protein NDU88_003257 [Pleurodeles waltl]